MAPEKDSSKRVGLSLEELDILDNRVAVALARHDDIVKGWMKASNRPPKPPVITDEEIEAQIMTNYGLDAEPGSARAKSSSSLGTKTLHSKLLPSKTLKASKARNVEEKAASVRRGLRDESGDEEEGRSGVGRTKKGRVKASSEAFTEPALPRNQGQESTPVIKGQTESQRPGHTKGQDHGISSTSNNLEKRKPNPELEESSKKARILRTADIASLDSITREGKEGAAAAREPEKEKTNAKSGGPGLEKVVGARRETDRLKKRLKKEKKKRLQAEAAASASRS